MDSSLTSPNVNRGLTSTLILAQSEVLHCSDFSEKRPPSPGCRRLHTWSPVSGAVWGGSGGAASLDKGRQWRWSLRVHRLIQLPIHPPLPNPAASQLLAARRPHHHRSLSSGTVSPNKLFLTEAESGHSVLL